MTEEIAVCKEKSRARPRLRVRLGFWLILGLLSTAIPEVPEGAEPDFVYDAARVLGRGPKR